MFPEDSTHAPEFPRTLLLAFLAASLLSLPFPAAAQGEPAINVEGVEGPLRENLLASVQLQNESCETPLVRLQRRVPELRRRLVRAMNALGYYHATLRTEFNRSADCWALNIGVQPGEPVTLREVEVDIAGNESARSVFDAVLGASPLTSGAVLHHGEYENFKERLTSTAADNGFFDARFTEAVIALDLPAKAADISLRFDPGLRYRFGELRIDRPGILSDTLIGEMLPVNPGDPYSADQLEEMRLALDRSGYFNQISITPQIRAAVDRAVPVQIDLNLRPRHKWTGGVGFTTDTGPRARLTYDNRFINSRGHRFSADTALSAVRGQINSSYSIPLNRRFADDLVFTTAYIVEDNDAFESKRVQMGISLPSENPWGWQQNLTLDLQRDDYQLASQEDVSMLYIPGISLGKTAADNLINPARGWKLHTSLKGASDSVLSDTTFMQWYTSAKLVRSFGIMRLITRGEVGATWIDDTGELPASLRFFAGGDQSVRGYDFRSLGPMDENGEVEGGKQLLTGSVEVDFRVRPDWRLALFADAGNAFNNTDSYELHYSAGVGIRWMSPIGPVRFDLARPFDAEENFRIHITMGPDL